MLPVVVDEQIWFFGYAPLDRALYLSDRDTFYDPDDGLPDPAGHPFGPAK